MNARQLVLYRQAEDSLFNRISDSFDKNSDTSTADFMQNLSELLDISISHGFYGNLWHCYIAYLLVNEENAFSISCEKTGVSEGTLDAIALSDFAVIYELFNPDAKMLLEKYGIDMTPYFSFSGGELNGQFFNKRITGVICKLAEALGQADSPEEFEALVLDFYKRFGVGMFGLHKAFRLDEDGDIVPITKIAHVRLDDLYGYEIQKEKLIENTESFIQGKEANNCLLYGDAGTGKSTSIKAIINQYYDDGLRIIEVYKHEFKHLNKIISRIKNRNYKFIIYMDDLSFEEFEIEYKYLKAVIEGGLENKPKNILIYATSNRRHLIRETFKDKQEYDDLHKNDTVQEKLSLYDRFGVTIYYGSPSKKEFQQIVLWLKEKYKLTVDDETLLAEANKWEMSHGGLSGRTAQQFITYMSAKE